MSTSTSDVGADARESAPEHLQGSVFSGVKSDAIDQAVKEVHATVVSAEAARLYEMNRAPLVAAARSQTLVDDQR